MLTKKQVSNIREHLERAQNPIFFFDNDQDGLCSFLLLQRFVGRGKGVAIKSFPELDGNYFRKVDELNADYIFILDKPLVSKEFFEKVSERNIPVVWIDHHFVEDKAPSFVNYFNPMLNDPKTDEPVTALCYQVSQRKEDMWIAVVGCISDNYLPSFYSDFLKKYPDLSVKTKDPFEVLYRSKTGDIARIMNSGLKDTTTNVVNMLRVLIKAKSPYEILDENKRTYSFHKRAHQIYARYKKLFSKAKEAARKSKRIVFFKYSGDLGLSGELANELKFDFPKKTIIIARDTGGKISLSLRGERIKDKYLKAIEEIESARGGGHDNAVGGQMSVDDWDRFKENLEKLIN